MAVRVELRRDAGKFGPAQGPWVRRSQVARVLGPPDPKAIAELVDHRGQTLGFGLYSPDSGIVLRMLGYGARPGEDWLEQRLHAAIAARQALGLGRETTGYRELNSEGDGVPGLVVDRFGDARVVQCTTAPIVARWQSIVGILDQLAPLAGPTIVLAPESAASKEGFTALFEVCNAALPEQLEWLEHGRRLLAPAPPAQKTGAYHDQRENRQRFAELLRGRGPVLDLGTHVGGFAIAAAARGSQVIAVDQSKLALDYLRQNAMANQLADRIEPVAADMFASLDDPRLAGPFAGIIFDPPKIAASRRDVGRALAAMTRTLAQLQARVLPQGLLAVCSCSHHLGEAELDRALLDASKAAGWTRIAAWGAGPDHPIAPGHAEGEYLRVREYMRNG